MVWSRKTLYKSVICTDDERRCPYYMLLIPYYDALHRVEY